MKKVLKLVILLGFLFTVIINLPKTVYADCVVKWNDGTTTTIKQDKTKSGYKQVFRKDKKEFVYYSYLTDSLWCGSNDSGWITINKQKYYMNPSTKISAQGFKRVDGYWYYFNVGKPITNTTKEFSKGHTMVFDSEGKAVKVGGLYKLATNVTYYLEPTRNGYAKVSYEWQRINGKWHYFYTNGIMVTGWQKINNKYYYFGSDGVMKTGWQTIDGKKYYFNENGESVSGWTVISNHWYYFNTGSLGRERTMKTGWFKYKNHYYYLQKNGQMRTGWYNEGSTYYYFGEDGIMRSSNWQKINGKWYYFKASGQMYTGWLKKGGHTYYLLPGKGYMLTSWQKIGNNYYWFNSNGEMALGWKTIGGKKYYFSKDTRTNYYGMRFTGIRLIDGKKYYFGNDGVMQTGLIHYNGFTYYFTKDGSALVNTTKTINGKKYKFDKKGHGTIV